MEEQYRWHQPKVAQHLPYNKQEKKNNISIKTNIEITLTQNRASKLGTTLGTRTLFYQGVSGIDTSLACISELTTSKQLGTK